MGICTEFPEYISGYRCSVLDYHIMMYIIIHWLLEIYSYALLAI